jgi:hypothetical protein
LDFSDFPFWISKEHIADSVADSVRPYSSELDSAPEKLA